jgi:hypothetical protein
VLKTPPEILRRRSEWWASLPPDHPARARNRRKAREHWHLNRGNFRRQHRCCWCREVIPLGRHHRFCGEHCRDNWRTSHGGAFRPPHDWFTASAVADNLGISRGVVRTWIREGLPFRTAGGIRWLEDDVVGDWIAAHGLPVKGRKKRWRPPPPVNDPLESGTIYALCEPSTGAVRYIGKARHLTRRLSHYRSHPHSPHLRNWFAKLKRKGLEPRVRELEQRLFGLGEAEQRWIAHGRKRGWRLINVTEGGGSGAPLTPERRAQLGQQSRRNWTIHRERMLRATHTRAAAKLGLSLEQWYARREEARARREAFAAKRTLKLQARAERKLEIARRREPLSIVPVTCGDVAFVPLTGGRWAKVDVGDWERVGRYRWHLQVKGRMLRAKCSTYERDGQRCRGAFILTRFIMNAGDGEMVTPLNGDHLDCRRTNLAVVRQPTGRPRAAPLAAQRSSSGLNGPFRFTAPLRPAQVRRTRRRR